MFGNNRFLKIIIFILLFVLCFSASSCKGDKNETYLDGTYMNAELKVGYIFFPDGTGFQFISENRFLIQYEISDGMITITTLLDDSKITESFPFEKSGDSIVIDGVSYIVVPEDTSGVSESMSVS